MKLEKAKIRHSCGCEETVDLYGTFEEREKKKLKLQSRPCSSCLDRILTEKLSKEGLPPLEGTEKQVKWATDIRNQFLSEFLRLEKIILTAVERDSPSEMEMAKQSLHCRKAVFFGSRTNARYYIENRDDIAMQIRLFVVSFKKKHPALWDEDMERL